MTLGATTTKNSGTYTVSETVDPAYTRTFSGDCDGSGSITLIPGTTKTCTITNEEKLVVPTVASPTATAISTSSVTLGANVTSLGVPHSITARGICYSTSPSPTLTNGATCVVEGGTSTGVYTQAITGLTPATLYYYVGYATNTTGTGYTSNTTFTTLSNSVLPTVTTVSPITSVARTTASGGGNVTSDGGATVTARGVVWSTSINPTVALSTKTSDGTGTGSFVSSLTGLTCNTLYHVRAYATNSVGTSYGSDITFTTSACSTITYIAQATSNTTSVTLPAHNVGDLLVMFAYRSSSNAVPTVPAGWTTINASGSANNSSALAYRIATGADTATGWSNATQLVVQVYRGVSTISPIGNAGTPQFANGKIVTYPAITLSVTDGTSWVIGSAGAANNSSNVQNPPTGMVMRANIIGTSAEAAGFDTNGGVSSWGAQTVTISASNVKWSARTLEIKSQ